MGVKVNPKNSVELISGKAFSGNRAGELDYDSIAAPALYTPRLTSKENFTNKSGFNL